MKKQIWGTIAIALSLAACSQPQQQEESNDIKILAELRPEVNYVTHLYTLANLGFEDNEYAAKYGSMLPQAAIDTLQKYHDYLTFGQGEGGMLAGPFFFGVSAAELANADSMQILMDKFMEEGRQMNATDDVIWAAQAIANVYVENYDQYLKEVYPKASADMEERITKLNEQLQKNTFVKDWERVTGYTWNRGDYHWLLYRAGENGPSYNNLNENHNTVYYNQPFDYQLSMFSHEFGIFLMQDSINPIYNELKDYVQQIDSEQDLTFVPWSAFESLSCWYGCQIAGTETIDYLNFGEANVETFCQIYDSLTQVGITKPTELYRQGIMEYLKKNE